MATTRRGTRTSRIRVPRRFVPGATADSTPGSTLRVVALGFDAEEIFGVDLASRAFVRINMREPKPLVVSDEELGEGGALRHDRIGTVYRIDVAPAEPIDAGRPEALWTDAAPTRIGGLTRQGLRRLCAQVRFGEHPGALVLGSRARAVAYAGLRSSEPSMMLIGLHPKRCRLVWDSSGRAMLTFVWGGLEQSIVVHDPRAQAAAHAHQGHQLQRDALARALGFKVRYALFGYARVEDRYVEKVVVSLIGRSRAPR